MIQWVRVEDNVQTDVIRSANLELTEDMVGDNTWLCEARNHYGGEDYHQNKNYTFVVGKFLCTQYGISESLITYMAKIAIQYLPVYISVGLHASGGRWSNVNCKYGYFYVLSLF